MIRYLSILQSQIDDKDRTIKIQQNQIDKLEKDVVKLAMGTEPQPAQNVDTTNIATQTDRVSFNEPAKTGPLAY